MTKKILVGMLAFAMAFSGIVGPMNSTLLCVRAAETSTQSGIVNFGRGTASITIQGNTGQTLVGKKFHLYKLFHAENSVGGESVNYTFNSEYQTALRHYRQQSVAQPRHRDCAPSGKDRPQRPCNWRIGCRQRAFPEDYPCLLCPQARTLFCH